MYQGTAFHPNQFQYQQPQNSQMTLHPDMARQMQMRAYRESPDGDQQMFERRLQQQEQSRKAYDSETARQGQQQKFGVLGNLLGGGGMRYGR